MRSILSERKALKYPLECRPLHPKGGPLISPMSLDIARVGGPAGFNTLHFGASHVMTLHLWSASKASARGEVPFMTQLTPVYSPEAGAGLAGTWKC
jgi:hypothetical protein